MEKYYDPIPVSQWMEAHPLVPIGACLLYGLLMVAGQAYFRTREPLRARTSLAAWNLFLALFSLVGMLRTFPQLVHNLATLTLRENLCANPQATYGSGSTGLWVQLFILSKFPELIDTVFIIVNKKKLIFLHWYHHITVLLYCWHSYVTKSPPGIFFVVMNYTVHASMYGYYFLMAIRARPRWLNPMIVTTMQISQMVVGVAVTLLGFYYSARAADHQSCRIKRENNTAAFVMYGSYLFLFLQFFVGRYVGTQSPVASKKTA